MKFAFANRRRFHGRWKLMHRRRQTHTQAGEILILRRALECQVEGKALVVKQLVHVAGGASRGDSSSVTNSTWIHGAPCARNTNFIDAGQC
jgi:hypothetical protein